MATDVVKGGALWANALHEALVAMHCLGPAQFLGRSVTPDFYLPVPDGQGVPAEDPLRGTELVSRRREDLPPRPTWRCDALAGRFTGWARAR
ncbi:hypothetical protein AB0C04_23035 [Micromonospora sp. NPDC048909]|uniref:hypothetical protein n=1 Tax=Micromonospora sp. NPDC048909 TaxID=3155643 RepID=UPI0033CB6C26